jgi:hypothetical protein
MSFELDPGIERPEKMQELTSIGRVIFESAENYPGGVGLICPLVPERIQWWFVNL